MYIVYRHLYGISLNGKEYLLNDKDELMRFDSPESATHFLLQAGYETDDIDECVFIEEDN